MMKSLVPWLLSLFLLPLVSCIHTSPTSSDPFLFNQIKQLCFIGWNLDEEALFVKQRLMATIPHRRILSVERPLRRLEQSPTKSISHGETVNDMAPLNIFYNGRKRTSIVYKDGLATRSIQRISYNW